METIPHKRGDTFLLTCTTDVPLTGYSIASQVRDKSFKLIAQLTVNITQTTPTGIYTLSYPAGSSSWRPSHGWLCSFHYPSCNCGWCSICCTAAPSTHKTWGAISA